MGGRTYRQTDKWAYRQIDRWTGGPLFEILVIQNGRPSNSKHVIGDLSAEIYGVTVNNQCNTTFCNQPLVSRLNFF